MWSGGGVRVRAYVVEQPVQEDVRLHRRVPRAARPLTSQQEPGRRRESAGGAGRPYRG